ncbi:CoA transferase subunit A [Chloroflexota bacterium]
MDKVWNTVEEAIVDVEDGATIAIPGFFAAGVPRILLRALIAKGTKNLTLACGCGPLLGASEELAELVKNKQIKKVIDSYGLYRSASKGMQDSFEQAVRGGEIELEVYPMGTLAEKYRAAGAGIPASYLPTGTGSVVERSVVTNIPRHRKKKETRIFGGERYVLEYALKPDFAFVHAHTGDREGNLRYNMTARNFNPVMAAAGKVTIAEVENLVEPGGIAPDDVHTPGIYVQRVVKVPHLTFAVTID